jgi:hypothetical protein
MLLSSHYQRVTSSFTSPFLLGLVLFSVVSTSALTEHTAQSGTCSGISDQECVGDVGEIKWPGAEEEEEEDFPCTLYIAESSIPNAGLGTYTAISMEIGQIAASLGDPLIAHIDVTYEQEGDTDYHWAEPFFPFPLFDTDFPSLFMDFGATHGHSTLANLKASFKTFKRDSAGLHRFKDPGAGAITMYHDLNWEITENVPAGSELFVKIGPASQAREKKIGYVPTGEDYEIADKVLFDALDLVRTEELTEEDYEDFLTLTEEVTSEHIRALLPSDFNDIKSAAEMGSAKFNIPTNIKTPEWLKENGWCIDDKLKDGISKIPQAGRGVFAKQFIKKGSSVAPFPVVIFSRDFMDIRDTFRDEDTGRIMHKDDVIEGKQMTINYCFSHPNSSLMIIPNSAPVLYINHDGDNPNTKIRWIDAFNMKPDDWLSKSPDELLKMGSGPMIEFYALRDIKADEEITVDYGPEWEAAWTKHVESWDPKEDDKNYIAASDYMEQGLFTVLTEEEQKDYPYPENLDTACYFTFHNHDDDDDEDDETLVEGVELDWSDYSTNRVHTDVGVFECLYHCNILSSQEVDGTKYYEVALNEYTNPQFTRYDSGKCWIPGQIFVDGMPSEKIIIIDKPYTSDEHIDESFRHEIGVPEGFFPTNWLDIPEKEKGTD